MTEEIAQILLHIAAFIMGGLTAWTWARGVQGGHSGAPRRPGVKLSVKPKDISSSPTASLPYAPNARSDAIDRLLDEIARGAR